MDFFNNAIFSVDKDSNGSISREEMKQQVIEEKRSCSEEVFNRIFNAMDIDGDQEISFWEYAKVGLAVMIMVEKFEIN